MTTAAGLYSKLDLLINDEQHESLYNVPYYILI
jgi:hypothetical protein